MSIAPDYAEPFEVWRVWRVVRHAGAYWLGSIVQETIWPVREAFVAECLRGRRLLTRLRSSRHLAPEAGCECGIYGTSLEGVAPYLADAPCRGIARVVGRVALWGWVVECERGFRAACAYPLKLYVPVDAGEPWCVDLEDVAFGLSRYGVPIEPLASRAAEAQSVLAERPAA